VERALGQRLVDIAQPVPRLTLGQDRIERIEAAHRVETHEAALGRIDIDIVEMREAGGVFGLAQQRRGVVPFAILRRIGKGGRGCRQQGGGKQRCAEYRGHGGPPWAVKLSLSIAVEPSTPLPAGGTGTSVSAALISWRV